MLTWNRGLNWGDVGYNHHDRKNISSFCRSASQSSMISTKQSLKEESNARVMSYELPWKGDRKIALPSCIYWSWGSSCNIQINKSMHSWSHWQLVKVPQDLRRTTSTIISQVPDLLSHKNMTQLYLSSLFAPALSFDANSLIPACFNF